MAAVQAGYKRSYAQMRGDPSDSPDFTPTPTRNSAPSSRSPSRPPDLLISEIKTNAARGLPRKASFEPSASIVLIGVRGVGKSTLAVLAATAYSRRIIEVEKLFAKETGSTPSVYRKNYGAHSYQRKHEEILDNILQTHTNGAVIVCSFVDLSGNGASLLAEYAQSHAVIHVTRDATGIRSYLRVWTIAKINELLLASSPLLRSCSNYEFYNLTESTESLNELRREDHIGADRTFKGSSLTLKRVERDFVRLLRNIIGDHDRGPAHHSAYPLSKIPVQKRSHTFAVTVHVSDVIEQKKDLDDVQIGADCIELVIDARSGASEQCFIDAAQAFSIVRRNTILPILVNPAVKPYSVQAKKAAFPDMTEFCLRLGPELCAFNLDLDDSKLSHLISSKGGSKTIAVRDWDERLQDGWHDARCMAAYARAIQLGFDIVKITMPSTSAEDVFAIQAFQQAVNAKNAPLQLIAYGTGAKGRTSRCFNKTLTSVEPHHAPDHRRLDHINEEGSLTAKAITQSLFASFVLEPMDFFIYGSDVSYSLSPVMHNASYQALGIPYNYETYSRNDLAEFSKLVQASNFGGAALTQPFKTVAVSMMDGLSRHAKAIQAVNTIIPVRQLAVDGSLPDESTMIAALKLQGQVKALYGFNTDWIGIRACIRRGLSPANSVRPQSSGLVCGAGGMARSAVYSMISLGVRNIFICNRTHRNAMALADHYNKLIEAGEISDLSPDNARNITVRALDSFTSSWPQDVKHPTMIVCCIPTLTDQGAPTGFSLPDSWLKSPNGGVVVEVAYRKPVSPLIRQIKDKAQAGWILMDGFDVLPEQAFPQFEIFTGRRAPRKLMRDEVLKHYSED